MTLRISLALRQIRDDLVAVLFRKSQVASRTQEKVLETMRDRLIREYDLGPQMDPPEEPTPKG